MIGGSAGVGLGSAAFELSGLSSVASLDAGDVLSVLSLLASLVRLVGSLPVSGALVLMALLCSDTDVDTEAPAASIGVASAAAAVCALKLAAGALLACSLSSDIAPCLKPGETIRLDGSPSDW
ncbi:hypothetical protein SynA1560_02929 [Synechococcus sp. A15-60]|nr:hypothetical protein SynA1560_02929 [Synechococcus sp. A15-60]